jgi:hypothetical protein
MTKILILVSTLFFCFPGWSHPEGHGGPQRAIRCEDSKQCTDVEIIKAGSNVLQYLVQSFQLDGSWGSAQAIGGIKEISFMGQKGSVISYENPSEKDEAKRILYILISPDGILMGAGFDKSKFQEISNYGKTIGFGAIFGISLLFYVFFLRSKKKPKAPNSSSV